MIGSALRELGTSVQQVLFFMGSIGLPLLSSWLEEGFVEEPAKGQGFELTGVPGDQIKLQLPLGSHAVKPPGEFYATFRDAESQFETRLPVAVEAEYDDGDEGLERLFGRIVVPGVPGHPAANLVGTLWGNLTVAGGGQRSIEIPLSLRLVTRGEGTTSGAKDVTLAEVIFGLVVGVGGLTIFAVTALAYRSWATRIERQRSLARLTRSVHRSPASLPLGNSGHTSEE